MPALKRLAAQFLTMPVFLPGIERTTRGNAVVFTLHRLAAYGRSGHDPVLLVRNLEWLRRRKYRVVPLLDLIRDLRAGVTPGPRTVAFTLDDGYADFAEVAAPVFVRYECPVTVFLITGFLDGGLWMWWDRVRYAVEQTRVTRGRITIGTRSIEYAAASDADRSDLSGEIIEGLKTLPDTDRVSTQRALEEQFDVPFPAAPPAEFGPMSWDQVRSLAGSVVSFGPHTVSHPILARTDDARSRAEIAGSWARLAEMVADPVPVFCWPNGDVASFGAREQRVAEEIGMLGAVSMVPGAMSPAQAGDGRRYALPRYAYPANPTDFIQVASGLERLKERTRAGVTGP